MNAHKISVKLFATTNDVPEAAFIPVFHRWIQGQAVADHLLIDVTDYAHVPSGPGTVLVSHEANLYSDRTAGRLGLLYSRKQPFPGSFRDRARQAVSATLTLAAMLESDPEFAGKLQFRTDEILIRIHDRLLAPNTPETFAAVQPDLQAIASDLYAGTIPQLIHTPSSVELFGVTIKSDVNPGVSGLLERMSAIAAV
ncbi:MAG TPA: hypothetical protein VGN72_01480 [Tepidisphaeraceae bacterium]|jgi:hypothetical protein|nr:hypothetical protein [Tepidisphaeraceae bacterium]